MSFPSYPSYRQSGIEWLGDIPEEWTAKPLSALASCNDDVLGEDTPDKHVIRYIEISDVSADGCIIGSTELSFSEAPSRARRLVQDGDVIVSTVRTYLRAIAAVRNPSHNTVVSTGFAVMRPQDVDPTFLSYLFRAEFLIAAIIARSTGVSYPAINASEIRKLKVPVPPRSEQAYIAHFLDEETAKISALVAEQERLIGLLKEKRQAVISRAVTKGLDPSARMKDPGVEWLGEIPCTWDVKRLKFIAQVQGGVAKGRELADTDLIEVPYLRVANVQDGYLDLDHVSTIHIPRQELSRYSLRPGDVLMNEGGDFDKLGRGHVWRGEIETCIHQNHVFAVRPRGVEPEWLALVTSSDFGRFFFMGRSKQSTNLASISSSNLQELPVPCPPREEQVTILAYLAHETARLDALIAEAEDATRLLQERRSALISAAVTGKIDVRSPIPAIQEAA